MRSVARAERFGSQILNKPAQGSGENGFAFYWLISVIRGRSLAGGEVRQPGGVTKVESVVPLSEGIRESMILRHVQRVRIKG